MFAQLESQCNHGHTLYNLKINFSRFYQEMYVVRSLHEKFRIFLIQGVLSGKPVSD
jgi:hypothetical protein